MILNPGKTAFTDAEHAEIRKRVEEAKLEGMTEADIAREADVSASTLNSYLKAKYAGNNDPIGAKLFRWLEARAEARDLAAMAPRKPIFQPLAVAQEIRARLAYARVAGRLILISGVPGMGKTAAGRQFQRDTPRTWLSTMDPSTSGVPTMLVEVLSSMGIDVQGGLPQALVRKLIDRICEAESGGLIIIDEAQHLSDKAIEQIRAINDKTQARGVPVGIALMGNLEVANKIGPTASRPAFAQVSSRVAQRFSIAQAHRQDAATLAQAWAGANQEELGQRERDFLVGIAMRPGGLRNIEMTFEGALLAARGAREPLTLKHLQGAFAAITDTNRQAA